QDSSTHPCLNSFPTRRSSDLSSRQASQKLCGRPQPGGTDDVPGAQDGKFRADQTLGAGSGLQRRGSLLAHPVLGNHESRWRGRALRRPQETDHPGLRQFPRLQTAFFQGGRSGGGIRLGPSGLVPPLSTAANSAGGKTPKPVPVGCGSPASPGCMGTRLLSEVSEQPEGVHRRLVERGQLARRQPPLSEGPSVEVEALLMIKEKTPPSGVFHCFPTAFPAGPDIQESGFFQSFS